MGKPVRWTQERLEEHGRACCQKFGLTYRGAVLYYRRDNNSVRLRDSTLLATCEHPSCRETSSITVRPSKALLRWWKRGWAQGNAGLLSLQRPMLAAAVAACCRHLQPAQRSDLPPARFNSLGIWRSQRAAGCCARGTRAEGTQQKTARCRKRRTRRACRAPPGCPTRRVVGCMAAVCCGLASHEADPSG